MKGNSTCHTTNEKFREGYDAIDWTDVRGDTAHPGELHRLDRVQQSGGSVTGDVGPWRYFCTLPGCDFYTDSNVGPYSGTK